MTPHADDPRVSVDHDVTQHLYVLTISGATARDAGEYAVRASNQHGGFTLKVIVVVREGAGGEEAEQTTCQSAGAGMSAATSSTTRQEEATSLVVSGEEISSVTASDVLSIDVSGAPGVPGAPVMELPPKPVVVNVGETVRLTCSVKGQWSLAFMFPRLCV